MAIKLSGTLLASLHLENTLDIGDQEGFLIGRIVNEVTDVISDARATHTKEECSIYVFDHIPCRGVFSWYNSAGEVIMEALQKVLRGGKRKMVVGWYKLRGQSSLAVSLRERAVHQHLVRQLVGMAPQHLVYLLLTSSRAHNLATHHTDYAIYTLNTGVLRAQPATVLNLCETGGGDYRAACRRGSQPSSFTACLVHACPGLDGSAPPPQVADIRRVHGAVQAQLTALADKVCLSELRLGALREQVMALRRRSIVQPPAVFPDTAIMEPMQAITLHHNEPYPLPVQSSTFAIRDDILQLTDTHASDKNSSYAQSDPKAVDITTVESNKNMSTQYLNMMMAQKDTRQYQSRTAPSDALSSLGDVQTMNAAVRSSRRQARGEQPGAVREQQPQRAGPTQPAPGRAEPRRHAKVVLGGGASPAHHSPPTTVSPTRYEDPAMDNASLSGSPQF